MSNTYEFILKNDTTEKRSAVASGGGESGEKQKTAAQIAVGGSIAVINKIKPYVNTVVSQSINMVRIGTGQNEYAEKLKFGQEVANDVLNAAEAAALSAIVMSNPWGAVIGLTAAATSKAISIGINQMNINASAEVEGVSLGFARQRAGWNGSRGRYQ